MGDAERALEEFVEQWMKENRSHRTKAQVRPAAPVDWDADTLPPRATQHTPTVDPRHFHAGALTAEEQALESLTRTLVERGTKIPYPSSEEMERLFPGSMGWSNFIDTVKQDLSARAKHGYCPPCGAELCAALDGDGAEVCLNCQRAGVGRE